MLVPTLLTHYYCCFPGCPDCIIEYIIVPILYLQQRWMLCVWCCSYPRSSVAVVGYYRMHTAYSTVHIYHLVFINWIFLKYIGVIDYNMGCYNMISFLSYRKLTTTVVWAAWNMYVSNLYFVYSYIYIIYTVCIIYSIIQYVSIKGLFQIRVGSHFLN